MGKEWTWLVKIIGTYWKPLDYEISTKSWLIRQTIELNRIFTWFHNISRQIQTSLSRSTAEAGRNPFSPVKDLPILGFFGALSAAPGTEMVWEKKCWVVQGEFSGETVDGWFGMDWCCRYRPYWIGEKIWYLRTRYNHSFFARFLKIGPDDFQSSLIVVFADGTGRFFLIQPPMTWSKAAEYSAVFDTHIKQQQIRNTCKIL